MGVGSPVPKFYIVGITQNYEDPGGLDLSVPISSSQRNLLPLDPTTQ